MLIMDGGRLAWVCSRGTGAWLALVAATFMGSVLGQSGRSGDFESTAAAIGVLATACAKVWIIGFEFMELKRAPWFLRWGFNLWLISLGVVLVALLIA